MVGKWAVVLPLIVTLKNVISQPITEQDNLRQARQLNLGECCPCPDAERGHGGFRAQDDFSRSTGSSMDCPCQDRAADPDTAASMLLPALRAFQPFMKQAEEKADPKPLLQPEVGLASSVLETLREATDEEYQDALARDAARSAVKLIESDLSTIGDTLTETPKNVVRIFLNPKEDDVDDMDDNLPEPSHIQETRCIHSPLESIHNMGQLRMNRPTPRIDVFETPRTTIKHKTKPLIEVFDNSRRPLKQTNTQLLDVIETPRRPAKKINHKGLLHRNRNDMDSSVGASNVQERVLQPGADILKENSLNQNSGLLDLFSKHNMRNSDDIQDTTSLTARPGKIKKSETKINLKLKDLIDNLHNKSNTEKLKMPVIDLKKHFDSTTRLPPLKFKPLENPLFRANRPLQLKDLLKLKDVDVFSPNDVANFAATSEKPILHSQKLKSPDSNCRDDIINQITSESNRKELVDESSEQIDSIISPTSLNPVYNQGNIKLLDNNEDESDHSPDKSINNNSKSTLSIPEDNEAATISEIESEKLSIEHPQELPQNNLSEKESIRKCLATNNESDTPKIPSNHKIDNNEYKIELVEDLNLPIEFDESSFSPEIQSTDITNEQISGENADALQDPIAETSNNDFTVMEESNEKTATPQLPFENEDADCNIQNIERAIPSSIEDKNSENTFEEDEFEEDTIHIDLKDAENTINSKSVIKPENEIVNTVKDEDSNDNFSDASSVSTNYDTNTFSDPKDNSREVTYKDLQEMSNSILNLSECDSPSVEEENTNMENNKNRNAVEKQNESFETPDTELTSSMMSGEESKDINAEDDNITETGQVPDEINENGDDNKNPLETRNSDVKRPESAIDNEMEVEASERDVSCVPLSRSEPTDSEIPIQLAVDDDHNIPKVGTKQATEINTILQVDKHKKIINGLKSKLENLFTTAERAFQEDALANTEDNVNESSNNSPTLAYLNDPKSRNKLGRKSPTPLRDTLPLETRNSAVKKPKSAIDNEMEVEASERDVNCVPLSRSESTDSEIPIQLSVNDDHNIPKVGTKQATEINTISQVDKHTKFINGLKSKLENLFTTTERAFKEDALANTEDNVNESSNNSPTLAYLNDPKSLNKLGRKSATPLRDTLRSEIPGLTLNDFKNKLQIPKNLDKTIKLDPELNSRIAQLSSPISGKNTKNQRQKEIKLKKSQTLSSIDNFRPRNTQNNIESPFDLNPPFEDIIFGPGFTLNNLSDRLRSHTDNTIQNIKETFESRLKDSQSTGLRIPTNMINNEDILDTISSRRNELNEKLQAIHADINDRFSTFQQGVLDQLNAPSVRNSEFDPDSSNKRLKLPNTPLQLTLQDTFNFKSITNKQNSKSVIPHLTTFSEENDDTFKLNKFLNLPKKVDGMPRLGNSKIPNLKEVIKKQPRILLDRNNYRTAIEALPSKPQYNLKSSLRKPSINTSTPLIPRPKYFKTKIDIGPRQDIDSEVKATKTKPVLTKSTHVNLPKEPENSPSTLLPARINRLGNNRSDKEENVLSEDSSTDSPLEKLRKSLLRRNQEIKSKNIHKTKPISLPSPSRNSDEVADVKEHNVLSRLREGSKRLGSHRTEHVLSRSEDDHATSHSHLDATHSAAHNVERVMVEPLQENVPYKCKLICYKDV